MRVEAFRGGRRRRPRMLKYPLRDTPHFTIETNKTCNLRCRSCYSLDRKGVKSRAEIAAEVDMGLAKRNAGIVTLLGGEPTLHPELPGIVADIKAKGLRCQLLTNGLRFMAPDGDELLDALGAAGLDRVFVHIDEGQAHVHADIEAARRVVFDKLESRRMRFGLSLTVYEDTSGRIPYVLRAYAGYRHFDSVLAVLARDAGTGGIVGPELEGEYTSIRSRLGADPCAYVPSNIDDGDARWLIYYLRLSSAGGRARALPPGLFALAGAVHRILKGYRLYVPFLRLRGFRFIAIQTPPEMGVDAAHYKLCHSCPDATIRNGRLTPVCLADQINPLGASSEPLGAEDRLRRTAAYGHLGEIAGR